MAQALTMYKSLVGNVSSDKLNGAKPPAIEGEVEDDLFGKVKDVSSTTATRAPKKGNSLWFYRTCHSDELVFPFLVYGCYHENWVERGKRGV